MENIKSVKDLNEWQKRNVLMKDDPYLYGTQAGQRPQRNQGMQSMPARKSSGIGYVLTFAFILYAMSAVVFLAPWLDKIFP